MFSDRQTLVAALRPYGVDWLAPSDAVGGQEIAAAELIASLAAHDDPRLRSALTGLFLLHPGLSQFLGDAMKGLALIARDELAARYMAAVYLQRLWRTRLSLYLGDYSQLPDFFSASLGLPAAGESHGKAGLLALAEWHRQRSAEPYDRLSEYNRELEFVVAALKRRALTYEPALAGRPPENLRLPGTPRPALPRPRAVVPRRRRNCGLRAIPRADARRGDCH